MIIINDNYKQIIVTKMKKKEINMHEVLYVSFRGLQYKCPNTSMVHTNNNDIY